jgi:hypothetical protein
MTKATETVTHTLTSINPFAAVTMRVSGRRHATKHNN